MFGLGERIKILRKQKNMSQAELGAKVGRCKSVISNYESGAKIPPLDVCVDIASVLNTSLDYLVGIDSRPSVSVDGLTQEQISLIKDLIWEISSINGTKTSNSYRTKLLLTKLMDNLMK